MPARIAYTKNCWLTAKKVAEWPHEKSGWATAKNCWMTAIKQLGDRTSKAGG